MAPPDKEEKEKEEQKLEESEKISGELQPLSEKSPEKEPFNPHSEDDWSDEYRADREGYFDKYSRHS